MVEQVMIFTLGFLTAGLIALAVAPAFWYRAIRLSRRQLEMQLPLSPAEILAAQDLLRAEAAVEQRRLEQKAEHLEKLRVADRLELGRQTALILEQKAQLRALSDQENEHGTELATLERALAEASAVSAAATKESYDMGGLLARKDARIEELADRLGDAERLAANQKETLASLEAEVARQSERLTAQSAVIEQLEGEVATLNLQGQADQITLKTAAARIAEREEALELAAIREREVVRQHQLQGETARATESGYAEKIERLRSANADLRQALDAAHKESGRLTQELAELRAAGTSEEGQMILAQREENEILRQKIKEIGAAVVHAAGGAPNQVSETARVKSGEPEPAHSEQATA